MSREEEEKGKWKQVGWGDGKGERRRRRRRTMIAGASYAWTRRDALRSLRAGIVLRAWSAPGAGLARPVHAPCAMLWSMGWRTTRKAGSTALVELAGVGKVAVRCKASQGVHFSGYTY